MCLRVFLSVRETEPERQCQCVYSAADDHNDNNRFSRTHRTEKASFRHAAARINTRPINVSDSNTYEYN